MLRVYTIYIYIYIQRENYVIYIPIYFLKDIFSFRTIKNRFSDSNKKIEKIKYIFYRTE